MYYYQENMVGPNLYKPMTLCIALPLQDLTHSPDVFGRRRPIVYIIVRQKNDTSE